MWPEPAQPTPKPPPTARVFFALWPAPDAADRLAAIAGDAARQFGGRPTRADTVHLTLAFIGEVPEAQLPALAAAARAVRAERFELAIDRLGYWSHKHLLWAGCSAVPPALPALAADLQAALAAGGWPAGRGGHAFTPHLTLVRKMARGLAPGDSGRLPAIAAAPWLCTQFVLVRSRLSAAGSAYETIGRFPLADHL